MTTSAPDVVIRGGLVMDGSGRPPVVEDIAIRGHRIAARSSVSGPISSGAAREVHAHGLWVTPGFLDIHTHYDLELEVSPGIDESVRHGVTTIVMGNCSLSAALGTQEQILDIYTRVESLPRDVVRRWLDGRVVWASVGEYYDHLEREVPLGPNVASFVGHSNVRMAAMGVERALTVARADATELTRMEGIVRDAMEAGYLGLSLDMLPMHRMDGARHAGTPLPSQRACARERRRLAAIVRRYGGVLQAAPNEAPQSVLELLSLSAGGFVRAPLKTTIVAALDVRNIPWGHRALTALSGVANHVFRADVRFQALPSPFQVFSDGATNPIFEQLPAGAEAIGATSAARRRLFADPAYRARFRRDWKRGRGIFHRRFDEMLIVDVPDRPAWTDRSFSDVARELGQPPVDFFMDLVVAHDDGFRWVTNVANHRPAVRRRLLAHPATLPGFSDAGAHSRNIGLQDGALQLLREACAHPEWMRPEQAVARLTGEPAVWLGLDAGTLREGAAADVVVLDPTRLATGLAERPVEQRPVFMDGATRLVRADTGVVRHVFIGGASVFEAGRGLAAELGTARIGRLLRARSHPTTNAVRVGA